MIIIIIILISKYLYKNDKLIVSDKKEKMLFIHIYAYKYWNVDNIKNIIEIKIHTIMLTNIEMWIYKKHYRIKIHTNAILNKKKKGNIIFIENPSTPNCINYYNFKVLMLSWPTILFPLQNTAHAF